MITTAESQRTLVRIGAGAAILGAILAAIGNGLHPHLTNPTLETFLTLIASRADWAALHLIVIVSIFCILIGLFGVYRSIPNEPAAGLARLGFAVAVAGSTLVAVNIASDGFAMKYIAASWSGASAADQAAILPAAEVLHQINLGFYTVWIFLFLGIPFALYGLALLLSEVYPRWVGWLALVGGVGSTVVGMMQYVGGETALLTTLFLIFSVAITIWMFIVGFFLWRKSDTLAYMS